MTKIGNAGLSQAMMQGMLSAHSSLKQAKTQESAASGLERKANILQSEIDSSIGDVESKKAELEDMKERKANASAWQEDALSQANGEIQQAAERDAEEKGTEYSDAPAESGKIDVSAKVQPISVGMTVDVEL